MLICFDYDGVIVDSFDLLLSLCQRAQAVLAIGRAPTAQDLRGLHTLSFDALAEHIGMPPETVAKYSREVLYQQRANGWTARPFDGMEQVFARLAEHHRLAVVTASDSAAVYDSLTTHGLVRHVDGVLGGDLGLSKAERIQRAMQSHAASPATTWMVGDAASDVREGKRAGAHTAAVTWGYQPREVLAREGPDLMVDRPEELLSHLNGAA